MIQEIALTQLDFNDVANDEITNIGNIPMPSGTKFNDLVTAMPHTFYWGKTSFGKSIPCMLRIVPEAVIIGAVDNSVNPPVPYDVPCSDFTIYDLFLFKAHPNNRPKGN
jgi:hypothetical protein